MNEQSSRIVIFLGPTIEREVACRYLNGIYLPPAAQGDIYKAVCDWSPKSIILIDGAFSSVPAVRHIELLWALSEGIHVIGSSSMGALRAAELAPFGMQGSGFIYRWYKFTPLADDDEVAVAMAPSELGSVALTDALINIRITLRAAQRAGVITSSCRLSIESAARSTHYLRRNYRKILDIVQKKVSIERAREIEILKTWSTHNFVDQKRHDAMHLINSAAMGAGVFELPLNPASVRRPTPFRITSAWLNDLSSADLPLDRLYFKI